MVKTLPGGFGGFAPEGSGSVHVCWNMVHIYEIFNISDILVAIAMVEVVNPMEEACDAFLVGLREDRKQFKGFAAIAAAVRASVEGHEEEGAGLVCLDGTKYAPDCVKKTAVV